MRYVDSSKLRVYVIVCPHCKRTIYCIGKRSLDWDIDIKYCPYCSKDITDTIEKANRRENEKSE